jgi:hypothetical protein
MSHIGHSKEKHIDAIRQKYAKKYWNKNEYLKLSIAKNLEKYTEK